MDTPRNHTDAAANGPVLRAADKADEEKYSLVLANDTRDLLSRFDDVLDNASVSDVLADANRDGSSSTTPDEPFPELQYHGRWNAGDSDTYWFPQGISGSADALGDGEYEGHKVLLVSWYDNVDLSPDPNVDKGGRLTFVKQDTPDDPDYRHVLMVEPFINDDGHPDFRAVPTHAGGIAWYGNYVYVANTFDGLRVLDVDHMWKVDTSGDGIGRDSEGKYHAYGYKYVVPKVFDYGAGTSGTDPGLRYSFVGLDRTTRPDSIVVSEWWTEDEMPDRDARIVRWEIDYQTRELKTTSGVAVATKWVKSTLTHMQGIASVKGRFYISRSAGQADQTFVVVDEDGTTKFFGTGLSGPEDLYYDATDNVLWTQSEQPNGRQYGTIDLDDAP